MTWCKKVKINCPQKNLALTENNPTSKFKSEKVDNLFCPLLRIHLILMQIRILDPHWKKMDPDPNPGHEYLLKCRNIFLFFAKTWWTIQRSGNFKNLSLPVGSGTRKPKSFGSGIRILSTGSVKSTFTSLLLLLGLRERESWQPVLSNLLFTSLILLLGLRERESWLPVLSNLLFTSLILLLGLRERVKVDYLFCQIYFLLL